MDVSEKSTAVLIDELITTVVKCFFAQEDVMKGGEDAAVAAAARKAQELNARRNQLIRAIDERLGEAEYTVTPKTYAAFVGDGRVIARKEIDDPDIYNQVREYIKRNLLTLIEFHDGDRGIFYWSESNYSTSGYSPIRRSVDFGSREEAIEWAWETWVKHDDPETE
jgi:hypothetical protein